MLKISTLLLFSLTSCVFAPFSGDTKCLDCEATGADWHHVDADDGHFVHHMTKCSTHAECGVPLPIKEESAEEQPEAEEQV